MLALCVSACCAFAQSMSEKQIIDFVQQEQARGSNQQTIVTKLLQKGVTPDQLRRLKQKYEAEQNQMGAVNLTNPQAQQNGANRQRTARDRAQEQLQQRNGRMIRSTSRTKVPTAEERVDQMNQEIEFLDIDSVVYYQNLLRDESEVFGRNIFNQRNLTFEPSQNMATPANYRLGPGDNVIIDVWGASQQTIESQISPDGVVVVTGVGPIKLAGLSVQQATAAIRNKLGRYYADCSFNLSVADVRSIQVQVVGEVEMPGTYTLSSLSSAFNALYAAGGISSIGTLRDIRVYRG